MGNIFSAQKIRKIYIANQNYFQTPVKHPSKTVDTHIISYVLKGGWKLKIGEETINAKKDCVFIQPANIPRTGLSLCPPGTHTMFVHFSPEEGDMYTGTKTADSSEDSLFAGTCIDASSNSSIKNLLTKICEEKIKENPIKAGAYLNLLLCELSESSSYDTSPRTVAINAKKIINKYPEKNLSNQEIAAMLNVSIRTLETAFKNSFDTTVHRYQLENKIEQAKFNLEYFPEIRIFEIAQNLGFFDEYHFSKQFKRVTGISPKEYRRMIVDIKKEKGYI